MTLTPATIRNAAAREQLSRHSSLIEKVLEYHLSGAVTSELLLRDQPFELLRTDCDRDGYDLVRNIRSLSVEQGRNVPAAALTALARAEDRKRAMLAGFQSHITKPVDPGELVAVVATLTGRTGR